MKHKIKETILGLDARRREERVGISLRDYVSDTFPDMTVENLYAENDIDPNTTTLEQLFASDDKKYLAAEIVRDGILRGMGVSQREQLDNAREMMVSQGAITYDATRYISPETILDPVQRGNVQASFYQDLIIADLEVSGPTATMPQIQVSDAAMKERTELSTIETGTVIYGDKQVQIKEVARGLKISYEALRRHRLNLVSIYYEHLGRLLGSQLNKDAVDTLVLGDQANGSESAAAIGVTNAGTLAYKDVVRAFIRMSRLGKVPTAIVASEEMANEWLNLPEVKNFQQGNPVINSRLKTPIPSQIDVYVGGNLDPDHLMLVDASQSLVKLTELPLLLETDKVISKKLEETYASTSTGFANIQRDSRIIIDKGEAFAGLNFGTYSWLTVN